MTLNHKVYLGDGCYADYVYHTRSCPSRYGMPCECGADEDSEYEPDEQYDPRDFEDLGGIGVEPR